MVRDSKNHKSTESTSPIMRRESLKERRITFSSEIARWKPLALAMGRKTRLSLPFCTFFN